VVLRESGENEALQAVAMIQKGNVVDLTPSRAMSAAKLSLAHHLRMVDSMILAAAMKFGTTIWTQDTDFKISGR
ncbi:MAG: PIN domain-containing protein, partial [Deltaproteobacteria bacterium]|nr:PIN domain-containing protein [Deltaproteobacteria bacterium]